MAMITNERVNELFFLVENKYSIGMVLNNQSKTDAKKHYSDNYEQIFSDNNNASLWNPDSILDDFYTVFELVYIGLLIIEELDMVSQCGHFHPSRDFKAYNGNMVLDAKEDIRLTMPLDSSTIDKLTYFKTDTGEFKSYAKF